MPFYVPNRSNLILKFLAYVHLINSFMCTVNNVKFTAMVLVQYIFIQ